MPTSLRIPVKKEKKIRQAASKAGMTKTAFIMEAVDEKLGLLPSREQLIRETAGWLSRKEAKELREALVVFGEIHEEDWA